MEKHVRGFGDTPDSVVQMLLDYYEGNGEKQKVGDDEKDVLVLDPASPKDLTHTKVLGGRFGIEEVSNWSELIYAAHREGFEQLGSFEELSKVTLSNIARGERTDSGFRPIPGLPLSIQGASANSCWESAFRLAQRMRLPVEIRFRWRGKKGALYPEKQGLLSWRPEK